MTRYMAVPIAHARRRHRARQLLYVIGNAVVISFLLVTAYMAVWLIGGEL